MNFPTTYAATVTVPLPDDDVIGPVIQAYYGSPYQPDTTLNVVKMFAGTGAHFPGVIDTVNAIFGPEGKPEAPADVHDARRQGLQRTLRVADPLVYRP